MAGVRFTVNTEETLVIATDETILQLLAAADHRFLIERILIMGKSNTASDTPVEFEIVRQTSAGTSSSLTMRKVDNDVGSTLQATALDSFTSTEPTDSGDIPFNLFVHPQSRLELVFPFGREFVVGENERLGIKAINPTQGSTFIVQVEGVE